MPPTDGQSRRAGAFAFSLFGLLGALGLAGAPDASAQGRTCEGRAPTVSAAPGQPRVDGTEGSDVIVTGDGSQQVFGHGGDDTICAGAGFDAIDGGEGNDRIHAEGQDDVLLGRGGSDFLDGGAGFDTVDASAIPETCQDVEYAPDGHCQNIGSADPRLPAPQAPASVGCHYWAATDGNDGAPGSFAAPYGSVERLVNTLQPGEIGCLKPGTYTEPDDQVIVRGHGEPLRPITLRTQPGAPNAVIKGRLWVCAQVPGVTCSSDPRGAHDIVFYRLTFDGRNGLATARGPGAALPSPTVNGDEITFFNTFVTNSNVATCFQIGSVGYGTPVNTRILYSMVQGCGQYTAQRTQAHGDQAIVLETSRNARIANSTITDPSRRDTDIGVFLFKDAQGTKLEENRIQGFGRAVVFGRTPGGDLLNNTVTNNVIADSVFGYYDDPWHWQVEGYTVSGAPPATGNDVRNNCLVLADASRNLQPGGGGAYVAGPNTELAGEPCPAGFGPTALPVDDFLLVPQAGKNVVVAPVDGAIAVQDTGSRAPGFLPLKAPARIDIGSIVDASDGAVQVRGATATVATRDGSFQGKGAGTRFKIVRADAGLTQVRLVAPPRRRARRASSPGRIAAPRLGDCKKQKKPSPACCTKDLAKQVPKCGRSVRSLTGRVAGDYVISSKGLESRTRGSAYVVVVEADKASSITVKTGVVAVRDVRTGKTQTLRAGQTYTSR